MFYNDTNVLLKSCVVYRNPHDLWSLVRSRLAYEHSCWPNRCCNPPLALTQHLIFCSDDRLSFPMQIRGPNGDAHMTVRSKYTGFKFTICLEDNRLWLDCFHGGPGMIDRSDGPVFYYFDQPFYFPFSLSELIELPSYLPGDASGQWLRA